MHDAYFGSLQSCWNLEAYKVLSFCFSVPLTSKKISSCSCLYHFFIVKVDIAALEDNIF